MATSSKEPFVKLTPLLPNIFNSLSNGTSINTTSLDGSDGGDGGDGGGGGGDGGGGGGGDEDDDYASSFAKTTST